MQLAVTPPLTATLVGPQLWTRWLRLLVGLSTFASGLALMVRASLGLSALDVLHDGVAELSALSFGSAVVVVSVAVVAISAILGIRPGPATLVNMLLVGLV